MKMTVKGWKLKVEVVEPPCLNDPLLYTDTSTKIFGTYPTHAYRPECDLSPALEPGPLWCAMRLFGVGLQCWYAKPGETCGETLIRSV